MTDPFVYSEVDRTKSRWVAKVFQEFGRPKTTLRALFYYALSRAESDYPICCGFVGEIRITRPYHECDGEKLAKWAGKAQNLDFLPADAILTEALTPDQVLQWKIPMISQGKGKSEAQKEYKKYLQAYKLSHRKMAELDALEVCYPRGIAGFCDDLLARYSKD